MTLMALVGRLRLRPVAAVGLRLARRIRLLALIRLGVARLMLIRLRLAAVRHVAHRMTGRLVLTAVETIVTTLLLGVMPEVRIVLPELFLRRGNQAEVM